MESKFFKQSGIDLFFEGELISTVEQARKADRKQEQSKKHNTTTPPEEEREILSKQAFRPISAALNWLDMSAKDLAMVCLGNFIMAFALVNIHIPAQISEGGAIGLSIIFNKIFGFSPAYFSFFVDISLYCLGHFMLRDGFLRKAVVSTFIYSTIYNLIYEIGPVLPSLAGVPWLASILGGIMIGLGCGMVVTRGGVAGGDDCFSLIFSKHTGLSLASAYFIGDLVVLIGCLVVYMSPVNMVLSLLTTLISSYIVGQFEIPHTLEPLDLTEEGLKVVS